MLYFGKNLYYYVLEEGSQNGNAAYLQFVIYQHWLTQDIAAAAG